MIDEGDLREDFEALKRRVADLERRVDGRRRPELRVVRTDEAHDERSARSIVAAILAGASERQRNRTGFTHRDVRERLRDWADVLGYGLMLAVAAAQPTRDKQVTYAAYAIGELTIMIEDRDAKKKVR